MMIYLQTFCRGFIRYYHWSVLGDEFLPNFVYLVFESGKNLFEFCLYLTRFLLAWLTTHLWLYCLTIFRHIFTLLCISLDWYVVIIVGDCFGVKEKKYECESCGKKYSHQASLFNHTKYTCGKTANFFCTHCEFSTKYKYHIKQHCFAVHNIETLTTFNYQRKI